MYRNMSEWELDASLGVKRVKRTSTMISSPRDQIHSLMHDGARNHGYFEPEAKFQKARL